MSCASSPTRSTNLPVPLTPLVGRKREVAVLVDLLRRDDVRLLTLTGTGGVGKTRLALRVAADAADTFPDGVWFVGLAPITVPDLVASAIARAFGVLEPGDESLIERIKEFLRDKHLLLVLDNFEHVVEAAPLVDDLLGGCPSLTVLVTSRMRLQLYGEREHVVPPLAMPDEDEPRSFDDVLGSEAVRLFVERAQAVKGDFVLTAENSPVVLDVCRRLDGLPLAIELAAARIKVLPPAALLARLQYRLSLLTGGGRNLPTRQQTMRDALAWSHDLLTAEEQTLFRRLSVFVGGFTLEAAEAVGVRGGDAAPPSVIDLVASLVDKSLLQSVGGVGSEPRFEMLETVREFGLEQVEAGGEEEATRRRHSAYFLALGEALAPHLSTAELVPALDRLSVELPNVRAALAWALERGEAETVLRLAGGLVSFWNFRGHLSEGRHWLAVGLAQPGTAPTTRADALFAAAVLAGLQGDDRQAAAFGAEGLRIACAHDYRFGIGRALFVLAFTAERGGDVEWAAALYEESLAPLREAGHSRWVAQALVALADVTHLRGDADRAGVLAAEALALARQIGHAWVITLALGVLAHIACERDDVVRAVSLYEESLALSRSLGDQRGVAGTLGGIAAIVLARGQPERATRLLGAAQALGDSIGVTHLGHHLYYERILVAARAALNEPVFADAWDEGQALLPEQAIADALGEVELIAQQAADATCKDKAAELTLREREVLRLLVAGQTDREIGEALFISHRTVNAHVAHIFAKLGVDSRAGATAAAVRRGLN